MIPLNQNLSTLKRSAIRVYTNMAKEVPGCVMLTIGEPDFDTPEVIKAAACAALAAGHTHYAPNQGTAALRKAVADYETGRGHAVTPEQAGAHHRGRHPRPVHRPAWHPEPRGGGHRPHPGLWPV